MKNQPQQNVSFFDKIGQFCSKINLCLQPQLQSQTLRQFQQKHSYISLYKDPYYGQCHLVQNKRDNTKYLITKQNISRQNYQSRINQIEQINLISQGSSIKNILRASILEDIQKSGFLWSKHEVYIKYDYILFDLQKQFENRITDNSQFTQSEIKFIIRQCTEGFLRLQLNSYHSVRMKHIYFCNDGRDIKLAHPKLFNYHSNLQEIYDSYNKKNIYLSPEEIYALKIGNAQYQCGWISNSFSFGMIILSLMTMRHLNDLYNYQSCYIDFKKLKEIIDLSKNRFSLNLITIVQSLLQQKEIQRLTFRNLFNKIDLQGRQTMVQLTLIKDKEEENVQIQFQREYKFKKQQHNYPNYLAALLKPNVGLFGEYINLSRGQQRPSLFNDETVVANQRLRYSRNQDDQIGTYLGDTINKERNSSTEMVREGKGIYQYKDGQTYLGDWKEGKMDGYGKLYYKNKKLRYEGAFKKGLFNGSGTEYQEYQIKQREEQIDEQYIKIFKGNWLKYEGYFVKDKKQGAGKIYFSNGFWRGNFRDNQPNGEGIFTSYKNNKSTKGVWQDGELIKEL